MSSTLNSSRTDIPDSVPNSAPIFLSESTNSTPSKHQPYISSPSRPLLPIPSSSNSTSSRFVTTNNATNSNTNTNTRKSTYTYHPGCVLCGIISSASKAFSSDADPFIRNKNTPSVNSGSDGTPSPSPTVTTFLQAQSSKSYPASNSGTTTHLQPFSSTHNPDSDYVIPVNEGSSNFSSTIVGGREILFHDDELTIYTAVGKERLCGDGKHLIVVLNRHLERIYDLGPADIPILSRILSTTEQIFRSMNGRLVQSGSTVEEGRDKLDMKVGFVGSVIRDPQSPYAHLHAHALLGPIDTSLPGATFWRRTVVFGGMNWWSVEDLRAEIRTPLAKFSESSSNNRVKSGYSDRRAPINRVPDAGSITGLPNALEPDPYADQVLPRRADTSTPNRKGKSKVGKPDMDRSVSNSSKHGLMSDHDRPPLRSFSSNESVIRESMDGYAVVDLGEGERSDMRRA